MMGTDLTTLLGPDKHVAWSLHANEIQRLVRKRETAARRATRVTEKATRERLKALALRIMTSTVADPIEVERDFQKWLEFMKEHGTPLTPDRLASVRETCRRNEWQAAVHKIFREHGKDYAILADEFQKAEWRRRRNKRLLDDSPEDKPPIRSEDDPAMRFSAAAAGK